ncbi:hypothetical protein I3F58_11645 [Streptomyces sp. MUM 203J]|uniref:DUF6227 family protein n=1 Tax=Streptomyces sp. MUM 203J TaxID=2791990 RepID=UPI001F038271|nr:DUF6227 family protein [Streptomyces sp. MUM 203J]MCH0540211.1 hypothetical protein [Streptomyces sp. MUM 203J]
MNDPNDPIERNDPYETTEQHVERLLGRALNSFDLPDAMVERLRGALAHATALHSSHHSAALHRATYRHAFLLPDGTSLTLWELVHHTGTDGRDHHELYAEKAEVRLAAARLSDAFGSPDAVALGDPLDDDLDADLELLSTLLVRPPEPMPRVYVPDDSADHARRVLRRAENADRPGEAVTARLRGAFAHHIQQVFGRQCSVAGRDAGFSLYEHAFLLLDGTEISVWEVEHTATPDGRHMCEVYENERTARAAMESRARVR